MNYKLKIAKAVIYVVRLLVGIVMPTVALLLGISFLYLMAIAVISGWPIPWDLFSTITIIAAGAYALPALYNWSLDYIDRHK